MSSSASGGKPTQYPALHRACFTYSAIDNHAHPLLDASHRDDLQFEGVVSEAQGSALNDAVHTLAGMRAARQLGELFHLDLGLDIDEEKEDAQKRVWERLKDYRTSISYDELCTQCLAPTKIACVLVDDGLGGVEELAEGWEALGRRLRDDGAGAKRIVRVEILAEGIIQESVRDNIESRPYRLSEVPFFEPVSFLNAFRDELRKSLERLATDPNVAGFKSIACYRTGLDICADCPEDKALYEVYPYVLRRCASDGYRVRLADKVLNDYVVWETCRIAGQYGKPVQFHVGLGDNDIRLTKASPAHLQPLIEAFPDTPIVLLHSCYPWTREAGYLASVYKNAYLDFGEIFPFLSRSGQEEVIKQVLELAPTNKIMWSTDGHWWPESYYLGTIQAREALYNVLSSFITAQDLTERQAVSIVRDALFRNTNRIYNLKLVPPE